ncbi:MAG TPA: hypothetical protein VFA07_09255 [Chthonomonadaceae bacterium]|nr:hypothetical protein [Chthonomonadaceae bacterium]
MRGTASFRKPILTAVLLGPAALLCSSLPTYASLHIVDSPHHSALWQHIYDRLPALWKTDQTIRVEEVPIADLNTDADDTESSEVNGDENDNHTSDLADGVYIEDDDSDVPPTIRLADSLSDENSGLVFAHEYGHFIWNDKLTRSQRRDYRHLWWRQMHAGHLVTAYASDSPEEGFAEAFSYFLQKPDQLKRKDMESWRFLTQVQNDDTARDNDR